MNDVFMLTVALGLILSIRMEDVTRECERIIDLVHDTCLLELERGTYDAMVAMARYSACENINVPLMTLLFWKPVPSFFSHKLPGIGVWNTR